MLSIFKSLCITPIPFRYLIPFKISKIQRAADFSVKVNFPDYISEFKSQPFTNSKIRIASVFVSNAP